MNWKNLLLVSVIVFLCCNKKNKEVTYYDNGEIKSEYSIDDQGIRHGDFVEYYKNGIIKKNGSFLEGELNGNMYELYPTGDTLRIMHFSHGLASGDFEEFYPDGNIKMKARLLNDSTVYYIEYDSITGGHFGYFPAKISFIDTVCSKGGEVCFQCKIPKFKKFFEQKILLQIIIINHKNNRIISKEIQEVKSAHSIHCLTCSKSGNYILNFNFIPSETDTIPYSVPYWFICE